MTVRSTTESPLAQVGQGIGAELALDGAAAAGKCSASIPPTHKWALAGAAVVMAFTSACSTALALFLGQLVDGVQRGTQEGRSRETLYHLAASVPLP